MTETGGRPARLPAPTVPKNREAECLGLAALSSSAPSFLPGLWLPAVTNAGMSAPKCDGNVAAGKSTEALVGSTVPTATAPLRHCQHGSVSASSCRPMMSRTRSWRSSIAEGSPVVDPVRAERRSRSAPPGIEPWLSPPGDDQSAEYIHWNMTRGTVRSGDATGSSSLRSACLAAGKARDEKRNADERPPTGGEPDRHR